MPLDAQALAAKLHDALANKTDGLGLPTPISSMTMNYAAGIVAAIQAASVSNAPGTINGVTAPGGPLSAGSGTGGSILIAPALMLAKTLVGIEPQAASNMQNENKAIIQYIGTGLVSFAPGSITGSCTNTPTSPGPLAAGTGANGTIVGLTPAGAAAAVGGAGIGGPDALKHYTALITYILANTVASYPTGTVQGTCPPGGGPLAAGAATGGILS